MSSTACPYRRVVKLRANPSPSCTVPATPQALNQLDSQPAGSMTRSLFAQGNTVQLSHQEHPVEDELQCVHEERLHADTKQDQMPQPAIAQQLHRKRKAGCLANDEAQPGAKQARSIFQNTIAGPLQRAQRSIVGISKVCAAHNNVSGRCLGWVMSLNNAQLSSLSHKQSSELN